MVRKSLIVSFQIFYLTVLISRSILGASVPAGVEESARPNSTHFKYIGHLASSRNVRSHIQSPRTSFYYLSQNAAAYDAANDDCKSFYGDTAHLVYIETQGELAEVNKFIQESDDTGSTYWIGGRYDIDRATFVWGNGVEFGTWVPWGNGQPNSMTSATRVYVFRSAGGVTFHTQFSTVSTRFICELEVGGGTETSMRG